MYIFVMDTVAHVCTHAYIHSFMLSYIHACMHTCRHTYIHKYETYLCVCICVCIYVCNAGCRHCTYVPTHMFRCIHIYIDTCFPPKEETPNAVQVHRGDIAATLPIANMKLAHTYICICIHIYIYIYLYVYVHIHILPATPQDPYLDSVGSHTNALCFMWKRLRVNNISFQQTKGILLSWA